jgi:hypothetical protein
MFHGDADDVVPVDWSRAMNDGMILVGGTPRYTEIAGAGHDIWEDVYDGSAAAGLYPWLFSQVRSPIVTVTQVPDAVYCAIDDDQDPAFDGRGDSVLEIGVVGEIDTSRRNEMLRLFFKFELPAISEDQQLEKATLRLYLSTMDDPAGPVSLLHSVSDNDLEQLPSDYENTGYTDTLLDVVGPADEVQAYHDLDVTDFVLADLAADRENPMTAFRLQVDEPFSDDGQSAVYRFSSTVGTTTGPELILSLVPEPATSILIFLALPGVLASYRRRKEVAVWKY